MNKKYELLGVETSPELIWLDFSVDNKEEAITKMATKLKKSGLVKDDFTQAVLNREKKFCTGLQFDNIGVAIPHTEAKYVNQPAVSIAILRNPVQFGDMGNPETEISVQLIFMLAIKEPDKQLYFLQGLINGLQDSKKLNNLMHQKNKEEMLSYLSEIFK
ncbi:PTS sugar transporter subunit IIA [Vagococcus fluvialis]|nr:PTS sugar transporter subunit IIA [Vagococcus fluvialis]